MYKCSVIFIAFVVCLIGQNNVESSEKQQLAPIVSESFGLSYYSGEYKERFNGQNTSVDLHGISFKYSRAINTNIQLQVNGTFARGTIVQGDFPQATFARRNVLEVAQIVDVLDEKGNVLSDEDERFNRAFLYQYTIGVYLKFKLPIPHIDFLPRRIGKKSIFSPYMMLGRAFTGTNLYVNSSKVTRDRNSFSYAFGIEVNMDQFVAGIEYISLYSYESDALSQDITGINVSIAYKF